MWETGWNEKADNDGFLAVFPEGTPPDASRPTASEIIHRRGMTARSGANVGAAVSEVPDIEFVLALVADLRSHFSVDERRIYASGFSNGASMTFRVARELSDVIAAAAPVAGADWVQDTKPKRPVPLIYITGTADPLNPIGGGKIRIGKKTFGEKPATQRMIAKWVEMHSGPDKGRVVYDNDGATGIAYGLPGRGPRGGPIHHWRSRTSLAGREISAASAIGRGEHCHAQRNRRHLGFLQGTSPCRQCGKMTIPEAVA